MKFTAIVGLAFCATALAAPMDRATPVVEMGENLVPTADSLLQSKRQDAGSGLELGAGITGIVTQAITTLVPVGLQVAKTLAPLIQQFISAAGQAASSAGDASSGTSGAASAGGASSGAGGASSGAGDASSSAGGASY